MAKCKFDKLSKIVLSFGYEREKINITKAGVFAYEIGAKYFHRIYTSAERRNELLPEIVRRLAESNIDYEIAKDENNCLTIYIPADLEQ